ncbi:hypothetical protein E1B28_012890 [Marasmius oreades]|uniref:Mitochondrial carrier n=1 Tax=Marasmius oreades TaxID=181124 RepID=A0A9P7RT83_9AGAR|nr:uncharacterized protein E1B28_012890 [Marasmius oreades]KAG7088945.1 hypothetical protein E1B28_012890 [Marasmius oreades]
MNGLDCVHPSPSPSRSLSPLQLPPYLPSPPRMQWIYPLLLNATSRVVFIPFVGSVVRYRASYNPNYATLTGHGSGSGNVESGIIARPGRTIGGFVDGLRRTYRVEGWAGLYKGSIPILLETLIIRGSLAFMKIHPSVPLVLIAAPQLGIPEAIFFVLVYSIIKLPMTVFLIRSITTPYKLPLLSASPMQAFTTLLSPSERRNPYLLYNSPGLFIAISLQTALPLLFLHFVFDMTTSVFDRELEVMVFAVVVVVYVMAFLGSTVLMTPLEVVVVRLAQQENGGTGAGGGVEELEPLEEEGGVEMRVEGEGGLEGQGRGRGGVRYSESEDVIS